MTVTEDVLAEIYRRAGGDVAATIDITVAGPALALTADELRSAVRALEIAGLIAVLSEAGGGTRVCLTPTGIARCRKRGE